MRLALCNRKCELGIHDGSWNDAKFELLGLVMMITNIEQTLQVTFDLVELGPPFEFTELPMKLYTQGDFFTYSRYWFNRYSVGNLSGHKHRRRVRRDIAGVQDLILFIKLCYSKLSGGETTKYCYLSVHSSTLNIAVELDLM
jgi:hypothetical protein